MFTGLIEEVGTIKSITDIEEGKRFHVNCPKIINEIEIKDSIAVNGVCLTAIKTEEDGFVCEVVHVSLKKSTLGHLKNSSKVNLELAMKANARLGGHLVQGHVNRTCEISHIEKIGENWNFSFKTPKDCQKYIVNEGSICIDGTSLTISNTSNDKKNFSVTIIPHTLHNTLFHTYEVGGSVNLEFDVIIKYLESLSQKYST